MNTTKKKIFFALKYIFAISLIVGGILIFIENVKLIEIAKEKPFDVVVANITPYTAEVFWKIRDESFQILTYREKGSTGPITFASGGHFIFDDNLTKSYLYIGRIEGLEPDKEYEFHITSNRKLWRDGYSFKTPKVKENITMPTVTTGTATFDKLLLMTSEDGEKIMINSWYVGSYAFDSQGKKYTKQEYAQISTKEILREKLNSMLVRRVYAGEETPADRLDQPANCLVGLEILDKTYYPTNWEEALNRLALNFNCIGGYSNICAKDVYCTSLEAGINPWFPLVIWFQETGASSQIACGGHTKEGGGLNNLHDFGINVEEIFVNFKDQLDWFLKIAKRGTGYTCGISQADVEALLKELWEGEQIIKGRENTTIIPAENPFLQSPQILIGNANWGCEYRGSGGLFGGLQYWTKTNYHYALALGRVSSPQFIDYQDLFGESGIDGIDKYLNIGGGGGEDWESIQTTNFGFTVLQKGPSFDVCDHSKAIVNTTYVNENKEEEERAEFLKDIEVQPESNPSDYYKDEYLCDKVAGCRCIYNMHNETLYKFRRKNEFCGAFWDAHISYKCWKHGNCEEENTIVSIGVPCHALTKDDVNWYSSEIVCEGKGTPGGGPGGPGSPHPYNPPEDKIDCSKDPPGKADIIVGETCWDGGGCECFRTREDGQYQGFLKNVPCKEKCEKGEGDPEDIIIGDTDVICENENGCICIYPGPPERTERVELGDFCGKDGTIIRGDGKTILYITDEDQHCNNRKGCICYWLEVDPRIQKDVENKYVCLAIPPGDVVPVDRYGKEEIQMGDRYIVCENEKGCICMYSDEANTELVVKQGEACTPLPDPQIIRTILHIPLDNDLHCNDRNNCICQWDEISREPDWAVVTNKDVCKRDGSIEPKNTYGKEKLYITDEDRDCENESGCICIYPEGSGIEDKDVKIGKTCTTDGRVIETPNICCYNDNNETLSKLKPYICKEIPGEIRREIAIDYCSLNTKEYKISEGYNFINPVYVIGEQSSAPTTAHELINMSDNRVTTVALFQNGSWVKIVQLEKDSKTGLYKIFGPDFPLISGNTYLVLSKARLDFKFTVKGAAIPIPLKIEDLRSGWHLIPSKTLSSDTNKTAQDILNDQEFNLMHQIAQWSMPKSHFLYTVKDNENNIFGDEIKIGNSEGVFIRIKGNSIN